MGRNESSGRGGNNSRVASPYARRGIRLSGDGLRAAQLHGCSILPGRVIPVAGVHHAEPHILGRDRDNALAHAQRKSEEEPDASADQRTFGLNMGIRSA